MANSRTDYQQQMAEKIKQVIGHSPDYRQFNKNRELRLKWYCTPKSKEEKSLIKVAEENGLLSKIVFPFGAPCSAVSIWIPAERFKNEK